tara:strand:- start:33 stop:278 length:246 start_codon:yes stop_codon:yes gene_type:complete
MNKYICTVKAIITETYEVEDTFEINAPDEVQAEEDAVTAAENMPIENWLKHPKAHPNIRDTEFLDVEFTLEDVEEKELEND